MKTTVYLVRHIESEGNICRRNHAQFDNFPTRKGLMQAESLADRFDSIHVDAVYSSDLYRAMMTAKPLADRKGLKVQPRRLLREYTIGNWEGTGIGETASRYPELWNVWLKEPWNHSIPGCDRFEAVADRAYKAILDMAHENPGKTVVAVSHVTTITCALTRVLGKPIDAYGTIPGGENTAVSCVEVDGNDNMVVRFIADVSHLPESLKRSNYTGRTIENNFYYDSITDANRAVFHDMYAKWAIDNGRPSDSASADKALASSLSLGSRHAMLAVLMGEYGGFFMVQEDPVLPEDHGLLDALYVVPSITEPGMAAEIFGEALDQMRRKGKRYLVLKEDCGQFTRFFLERFLFEPMPGLEGYQRLRITVPGLEGPVY